MFFLSCGALSRPFSLVFVKTLPKEERPSRKRKKEEYNKKRRERSDEIVKGMSSIYRKILRYYSTVHLQFYPYYYTYLTPTHTITPTLTPTHTITPTLTHTHTITPTHTPTNITISSTIYYYYNYHLLSHYSITTII
jgi:hypothetical protein